MFKSLDLNASPRPVQAKPKYRSSADPDLTTMPRGMFYIVGNEAAERFSFYGVSSILTIFMTAYLTDGHGKLAVMDNNEAAFWAHQFISAVYYTPVIGALLADGLLGRYKTIFYLSIVYCLGHLALASHLSRGGLLFGLALIALGSGGIKPCVSANVGDQFGARNSHLLSRGFAWFYLAVSLGSVFSLTICPILLADPHFGPNWAFGLPGVVMLVATVLFCLGRTKMVHVPPSGLRNLKEALGKEGRRGLKDLALIYLLFSVWFALYFESSGIEWTLQATRMNLHLFGWSILAPQLQVVNTILIVVFIPLFNYWVYPTVNKIFPLTALRKISIGFFLMVATYLLIWWIQIRIDAGQKPSISWQILGYTILSASEVLVSVTGLEFSYSEAPKAMKSVAMALLLISVSIGNQITAWLNLIVEFCKQHGLAILQNANYFAFCTGMMFVTTVFFIFFSKSYKRRHPANELGTA